MGTLARETQKIVVETHTGKYDEGNN